MALAQHEWKCTTKGALGCFFTSGPYSSLATGDWEQACGPRPAQNCHQSGFAGTGIVSFQDDPGVSVRYKNDASVVSVPTMTGRTIFASTPKNSALPRPFRNFNAAISATIFPPTISDERPVEVPVVIVEERKFGTQDALIALALGALGWYAGPKIKSGKYSRFVGAAAGLTAGLVIYALPLTKR